LLSYKVKKVIREKYPEESYGVYFKEFPDEKGGIDLMIVFFIKNLSGSVKQMTSK